MSRTYQWLSVAVAAVGLALCGPASADKSQDFGEYIVHFNAITTDLLPPEVAKAYGIQRSKHRALLNVAVIKKVLGTGSRPVRAEIDARAVNLSHQLKRLSVREVREGNAVYYLAEFGVADRETLDFTIEITPEGADRTYPVEFRQQFYTD
ncbi:MAG: DUF4426 domain-containing protein [Gammaproteobacteria bacterium]|nr:DUF4426 domain-containing protein [Gammaproteobacteria bacterium]NIR83961.1 DUF4426 domain-containing protein [Gammaproteobacteria bacterium]NIU05259.1 DUF4426 domain-containing protein [Gammaproteobacteria bacterium]NIV52073.1 DUF4426 domain-containing protein [Gammaproteobacteria bacterium]NIV74247.1 DUF4426 domain-containing protein [Gammaproteobacteria bacterium]